jgi:hypothetical protein
MPERIGPSQPEYLTLCDFPNADCALQRQILTDEFTDSSSPKTFCGVPSGSLPAFCLSKPAVNPSVSSIVRIAQAIIARCCSGVRAYAVTRK